MSPSKETVVINKVVKRASPPVETTRYSIITSGIYGLFCLQVSSKFPIYKPMNIVLSDASI